MSDLVCPTCKGKAHEEKFASTIGGKTVTKSVIRCAKSWSYRGGSCPPVIQILSEGNEMAKPRRPMTEEEQEFVAHAIQAWGIEAIASASRLEESTVRDLSKGVFGHAVLQCFRAGVSKLEVSAPKPGFPKRTITIDLDEDEDSSTPANGVPSAVAAQLDQTPETPEKLVHQEPETEQRIEPAVDESDNFEPAKVAKPAVMFTGNPGSYAFGQEHFLRTLSGDRWEESGGEPNVKADPDEAALAACRAAMREETEAHFGGLGSESQFREWLRTRPVVQGETNPNPDRLDRIIAAKCVYQVGLQVEKLLASVADQPGVYEMAQFAMRRAGVAPLCAKISLTPDQIREATKTLYEMSSGGTL